MSNKAIKTLRFDQQIFFWVFVLGVIGLVLWLLTPILLPFILGATIAYLLDPPVTYMSRKNISRVVAVSIILFAFFIIVVGVLAILAPFLYEELKQLTTSIPDYIDRLWIWLAPYHDWAEQYVGEINAESLKTGVQDHLGNALTIGTGVVQTIAGGGQILAGMLSTLILTPFVAFFMMKDWPKITSWIDRQLPREHYDTITRLRSDIDIKISGFVRGQINIALALGIVYAIALTIAGLKYGVIIGLGAGLLSIIPLVGSTTGLLVSIIVAWLQAGSLAYVAVIASIFMVGQFIEGNILTPKLLGNSVGLHPLWILFSIIAGGHMMGLTGMLLAVPLVASIGVLTGFALEQYHKSAYYKAPTAKKRKTKSKKTKSAQSNAS